MMKGKEKRARYKVKKGIWGKKENKGRKIKGDTVGTVWGIWV